MKKIGVIGCGWLGIRVCKYLSIRNKIYTTTTTKQKETELKTMGFDVAEVQFSDAEILENQKPWQCLEDLDVIIITVPFPKKRNVAELRNRFENLKRFIDGFGGQLFLMSSIGIYPQVEMEVSEDTFGEEQLDVTIFEIEQQLKHHFPKMNILRLGGLMGDNRVFSHYKISDTHLAVNHVHYEDVCLVLEEMIARESCSKIYNVVAPLHPTKQEVINHQKGVDVHLSSQKERGKRVVSHLLTKELGYCYQHPDPRLFM